MGKRTKDSHVFRVRHGGQQTGKVYTEHWRKRMLRVSKEECPGYCLYPKERKKYRKNKNKHNGGFLSNWDKQADWTQGHGSASVMSDNTTIAFIVHFTCVYFVCMHLYIMCVPGACIRQKMELDPLKLALYCEVMCGCWELIPASLEQQHVLLTAEPSL